MGIDAAQLAPLILKENNQVFPVSLLTRIAWHLKGVIINEIDGITATVIANLFLSVQPQFPNVPLTYALACCDIESVFDPHAVNGNFLGSNPTKSLGEKDVGLCQFKLKELGYSNIDDAKAFAFDPARSLPHFFNDYTGLLQWAEQDVLPLYTPKWASYCNNKYVVATLGYNFGRTGALGMIQAGQNPSHGIKVGNLENWFAAELGVTPVMPREVLQ